MGCGQKKSGEAELAVSAEPGQVVAEYEGGTVTVADLILHALQNSQTFENPADSIYAGLRGPVISSTSYKNPTEDIMQARRVNWVTETVNTIIANRLMAEKTLKQKLEQTPEVMSALGEVKAALRDRLQLCMARKLQYEKIMKHMEIDERRIESYFKNNPSEFRKPATMKYQGIYAIKDKHGVEEARKRMEEAREKILKGESFMAVAMEYSDADERVRGRMQPTMNEDEVGPVITEAILAVPAGGITEIVELDNIFAFYRSDTVTPRVEPELNDATRNTIRKKIYEEEYKRLEEKVFRDLMIKYEPEYHPEWLTNPPNDTNEPIIRVGDLYQKSYADFYLEAEQYGYNSAAKKRAWLDVLAGRALALAEATDQGWNEKTVAARYIPLRNQIMADLYIHILALEQGVPEAERIDYYNQYEPKSDRVMDIYNIFIRANITPGMGTVEKNRALEQARGRAYFILAEIHNGMPFIHAANTYSMDPLTKELNGHIGRLRYGEVPKSYRLQAGDLLPAMEAGEISRIEDILNDTTGRYGVEIFYLADTEEPRLLSFEEAKPVIDRELLQKIKSDLRGDVQDEILKKANIRIDIDKGLEALRNIEDCAMHPFRAVRLWEYENWKPETEEQKPN